MGDSAYDVAFGLGSDALSAALKYENQDEMRPLRQLFDRGEKKTCSDDSFKWDVIRFSRGLAPVKGHGSPTTQAAKAGQDVRTGYLVDIKEHVLLPEDLLFFVRNPGEMSDNARAQIARGQTQLRNRIANTEEFLCAGALQGSVNLATPGGDFSHSIDYSDFVNTIAALTTWATASTKIASAELRNVKRKYAARSGVRASRVYTTTQVEQYLLENTQANEWLKQTMGALLARAGAPEGNPQVWQGMGGLMWSFVDGFYDANDSDDGNVDDFMTSTNAIVLPDESYDSELFGLAEGRIHVPAGPVFTADGGNAAGLAFREEIGTASYIEVVANPPALKLHGIKRVMPYIRVPKGVGKVTTTTT